MSLATDLRVLYRLLLAPVKGASHRERLESFYRHQAEDYDSFRHRLLHGRQELYEKLPTPQDGHWIEMGGGTGANLEYLGDRLSQLGQISIVDLSRSLLNQANRRVKRNDWKNVQLVEGDVTEVTLPPADVVTFSYSLTMIPNWFLAIDRAMQLLKPGGTLGIVDFYVARKYPDTDRRPHTWFTRHFWPFWFGMDNIYLSSDHIPYLSQRLCDLEISEHRGKIPYLPLLNVPYYTMIGKKASG